MRVLRLADTTSQWCSLATATSMAAPIRSAPDHRFQRVASSRSKYARRTIHMRAIAYGTEAAIDEHQVGEQCVVLETTSVRVLEDFVISQDATLTVEALGIGDVLPSTATTTIIGRSIAPLGPVHCHAILAADGSLAISWVRRSRIDFGWNDGVDQPIVEDVEQYSVSLTIDDITVRSWTTLQNSLSLDAQTVADLVSIVGPNLHFTVRQVGRHMQSAPISIEVNATT